MRYRKYKVFIVKDFKDSMGPTGGLLRGTSLMIRVGPS